MRIVIKLPFRHTRKSDRISKQRNLNNGRNSSLTLVLRSRKLREKVKSDPKNIKISTLKLKKNSFTIIIFYKKFDLFGYISYIFFPLYMLYMVIVRSATKSGKTGGSQKCVFCLSDWYLNNFFLCMPSERVTLTWKVFFFHFCYHLFLISKLFEPAS